MSKYLLLLVVSVLLNLDVHPASWERLYCMKSTDCYRHVIEASNGDYVLAGYTSNFSSTDTNGLVVRMDNTGDTVWTYIYDGPNHKEDCFYKVLQTSDGGFILCGYSRSFNGSDNALYVKISSSGNFQWVKNWGGSGIDRAQDIVELPNGKFVSVGYTTSSPAQYYDAFILNLDNNGSTNWSKIYGWSNYDDANSLKLLPDGGFIIGGQSANDLFLIRADNNGDTLWTKKFGTSGTDNIECVILAQGGGFVMSGSTNGAGSGAGNNGYVVMTDTSGNVMWSKTYGGNDNDDIHRIDKTSDGGYFGCGTSANGTWPDPNIWILKLDASGNEDWDNFFGGDNHDHGYSGIQTSDGGYIVAGHTHSFGDNTYNEDAIVIKTNSSGNVSNKLNYTSVTNLISPVSGGCGATGVQIKVEITNYGEGSVSSIPVTVKITGATTQTLNQTYTGTVDRDESKTLTFTTTINMSSGGTYNFHCFTGNQHDVIPARNFLDKSITVNNVTSIPAVTNGTHCGPASVSLTAASSSMVKWYANSSGGSSFYTGTNYSTPYLTSSQTYYVEAGTFCPSSRVPVTATITTGIAPPVASDQSRCGNGSVQLTATSSGNVNWYSSATSLTPLLTSNIYNTPSLSGNTTYYAESKNGSNCTSLRTTVEAIINSIPGNAVTTDGERCGTGSVQLSASGPATINWYDVQSGGSIIGTGGSFITPSIAQTEIFYAETFDGNCSGDRIPAQAEVFSTPTISLGPDTILTSASSVDLNPGSGFTDYLWSTSAGTQVITVTTDGNYCVTVTDGNGCMGSDCSFVQFSVGIENSGNENHFSIYEYSGIVHIINNTNEAVIFELFSVDGRLIDRVNIPSNNFEIDYTYLPAGYYVSCVTSKNYTAKRTIIFK